MSSEELINFLTDSGFFGTKTVESIINEFDRKIPKELCSHPQTYTHIVVVEFIKLYEGIDFKKNYYVRFWANDRPGSTHSWNSYNLYSITPQLVIKELDRAFESYPKLIQKDIEYKSIKDKWLQNYKEYTNWKRNIIIESLINE